MVVKNTDFDSAENSNKIDGIIDEAYKNLWILIVVFRKRFKLKNYNIQLLDILKNNFNKQL